MSARQIRYVPLDDLAPADRNAKLHDGPTIAASIGRFGFVDVPVMDERTAKLVAGHGRREDLLARRARGEDPPDGVRVTKGEWLVPVVCGWSSVDDNEALAVGIALNRTVEAGGWNLADLGSILEDLASTDQGLEGLGYDDADLAELLARLDLDQRRSVKAKPDDAPPKPAKPITKPGDLWALGDHRLLCGSAENVDDVARVMAGEKAHLFATDPTVSTTPRSRASAVTPTSPVGDRSAVTTSAATTSLGYSPMRSCSQSNISPTMPHGSCGTHRARTGT